MISALIALGAIYVVLAIWLLVHLGLDDETTSLMWSYVTNVGLLLSAVMLSILIGLIEAAVLTVWSRRRVKKRHSPQVTSKQ